MRAKEIPALHIMYQATERTVKHWNSRMNQSIQRLFLHKKQSHKPRTFYVRWTIFGHRFLSNRWWMKGSLQHGFGCWQSHQVASMPKQSDDGWNKWRWFCEHVECVPVLVREFLFKQDDTADKLILFEDAHHKTSSVFLQVCVAVTVWHSHCTLFFCCVCWQLRTLCFFSSQLKAMLAHTVRITRRTLQMFSFSKQKKTDIKLLAD